MKRLFLRLYISIALVLLIAAGVRFMLTHAVARTYGEQRIVDLLQPMMHRVRNHLNESASPHHRERVLHRFGTHLPFQLNVEPFERSDFNERDLDTLDAGALLPLKRGDKGFVAAIVNNEEILIVGPLRPPKHGAGQTMLIFGTISSLLIIGITLFAILRPLELRIQALTHAARRFGAGNLETRVAIAENDDLSNLGTHFNRMAERIQNQVKAREDLLQAVSHELRTPLARMYFLLDEAQEARDRPNTEKYLQRMGSSLDDVNELVEELLRFVRLEQTSATQEKFETAGDELASNCSKLVQDLSSGKLELQTHGDPSQWHISSDLPRAIFNLLSNGVRYAKSQLHLYFETADAFYVIRVEDDGPGIPVENRANIFDPFYRIDKSRNHRTGGTGLGLAIVKRIVLNSGGQVEVGDAAQGGAAFSIRIPIPSA